MLCHMHEINIFLYSFEHTFVTLIQNVGDILHGMFAFQMDLVGSALNGGVGTIWTFVWSAATVSHLVSPQSIVV